jgi:hypothetical protein
MGKPTQYVSGPEDGPVQNVTMTVTEFEVVQEPIPFFDWQHIQALFQHHP